MIHQIQEGNFSAQISELGAELISFKNTLTNFEYVWYGRAEYWTGKAPILFPNIGLLKDDEYVLNGKTFKMKKHGFARKSYFELIAKTGSSAKFRLKSSEESRKMYPFDFELTIEFEISDSKLIVTNTVKNTGNENMFFTIGGHPAFNLPLKNSSLSDYYVEFDKKEDLQCYELENGFLKHKTSDFALTAENRIILSENIFDNDALVFKNINSREISIGNIKSDFKLKLKNTGNAPHLGIWSKPGAPYVCIEPWHGHADFVDSNKDFVNKDNTIELNNGNEFKTGFEIEV